MSAQIIRMIALYFYSKYISLCLDVDHLFVPAERRCIAIVSWSVSPTESDHVERRECNGV